MIVKLLIALIGALAVAACSEAPAPSSTPAAAPIDPATVGTVTGKVVFEGTVPPPTVIRLDGDPKCVALAAGEERHVEDVVVGQGNTLQNVFVYIKEGLPPRMYPVPPEPVVLDQQKCRYVPRVLGIQVGQQLAIRNSDPLLHNVRSESTINDTFDVGTPLQGVEVKRTFATREVMVPFKCNVHNWMRAYVGVLEHPFHDVTDTEGRFSIAQLPPGTYAVEVWHERFGTQSQQVTVAAKETADLTFTFKVP
jgi:hypothetical protein